MGCVMIEANVRFPQEALVAAAKAAGHESEVNWWQFNGDKGTGVMMKQYKPWRPDACFEDAARLAFDAKLTVEVCAEHVQATSGEKWVKAFIGPEMFTPVEAYCEAVTSLAAELGGWVYPEDEPQTVVTP